MRAFRVAALGLGLTLHAHGRPNRIRRTDQECAAILSEFVEALPRYFSGPDPWVQLDRLPDTFADAAIARVYSEGPRLRWLVLEMAGPNDGWFERTNYFFDEAGNVEKRERVLEENAANVRIEESTYLERGRIIKTTYHHAPLQPGHGSKENWDVFYDPDAPEYTRTEDLPGLFLNMGLRQVG
jgi:hypothetical protein